MASLLRNEGRSIDIPDSELWARLVSDELSVSDKLTIGFISGSKDSIDGRVLELFVAQAHHAVCRSDSKRRLLVIKLDVYESMDLDRCADQPAARPVPSRSPLGPWAEISIPVPVGLRASWSLEQIPSWMYKWKRAFDLILIDLGPVHLIPSRLIGRLCNGSFLVLGPNAAASADWIQNQLTCHARSGSTIRGTLLSRFQQAA